MNSDKGLFCLPAMLISPKITFTDPMMTIMNVKCTFQAKTRLMLGAVKMPGAEAMSLGLVDFTAKGGNECMKTSHALAKAHARMGKNHALYKVLKERLFGKQALEILRDYK